MKNVVMIIGFGWAILGAGNIVFGFASDMTSTLRVVSLMFNMLVFIIPGLVLGVLGSMIGRKQT